MRVLGIIAEYNPFHYGHLYHLIKSKQETKCDFTIAVMSGQFTQRGEAAIVDKWVRAEAAIGCGVDLVLGSQLSMLSNCRAVCLWRSTIIESYGYHDSY